MNVDPNGDFWFPVVTVLAIVAIAEAVVAIGANHSINKANEKKIDSELKESYTKEEAENAIDAYFDEKYSGQKIDASFEEAGLEIENSYKVKSR